MVALKNRLVIEQQQFLALTRNAIHTVRAIAESTNKIDPFIPFLPHGSMVLADAEFDVEENYWMGSWLSRFRNIQTSMKILLGSPWFRHMLAVWFLAGYYQDMWVFVRQVVGKNSAVEP